MGSAHKLVECFSLVECFPLVKRKHVAFKEISRRHILIAKCPVLLGLQGRLINHFTFCLQNVQF